MLDFSRLIAPTNDGEVLVEPNPRACVRATLGNAQALFACDVTIAGEPLSKWRRTTRERLLGVADRPVIVTGHQPAFIHPGVWAKHVVAQSLAEGLGGQAVNLVVDNDAPGETTMAVPSVVGGQVKLVHVEFASLPAGHAYEQLSRFDQGQVERFRSALREALGSRYETTQLPAFFSGFKADGEAEDWVDQAVAGRHAVEAPFGVDLLDRRVSRFCLEPLLVELVTNSERFWVSYNKSLDEYRRRHRVRGHQRPIPNLTVEGDRRELPIWACRKNQARRRVYVSSDGKAVRLDGDGELIAELNRDFLCDCTRWPILPGREMGWMLRPRALTLTLWARLFLADIFIHGIGGAKYDRITDLLISDYFGIDAPKMMCVSATLWLDLPRGGTTREQLRNQRRILRDLEWNPQRYVEPGEDVSRMIRKRAEAIALSQKLRGAGGAKRSDRREVFQQIRSLNKTMRKMISSTQLARAKALEQTVRQFRRDQIAQSREFFFGLYCAKDLRRLVKALPDPGAFRV